MESRSAIKLEESEPRRRPHAPPLAAPSEVPNASRARSESAALPRRISPSGGESLGAEQTTTAAQNGNSYYQLSFDGYMFIDEDSISQGWRSLAKAMVENEQNHILKTLDANTNKFNTVGFCKEQSVQIISPFLVPPGPLRAQWMESFLDVSANLDKTCCFACFEYTSESTVRGNLTTPFAIFFLGTQRKMRSALDTMPLLLYWFDKSLSTGKPHITLEECDTFVSYDDGPREGYGTMPCSIRKIMAKPERTRTEDEERVMESFRLLERASGTPPFVAEPDYKLFDVVPTSKIIPDMSQDFAELIAHNQTKNINNNGSSPNGKNTPKKMPNQGDRVAVWWEDVEVYYNGTVNEVRESFYHIIYDDTDIEWIPLADYKFKILPKMTTKTKVTKLSTGNTAITVGCGACERPMSKQGHIRTCPRSKHYKDPNAVKGSTGCNNKVQSVANNGRANKRTNVDGEQSSRRTKRACTESGEQSKRRVWTKQEDARIINYVKNSSEIPFRSWAKVAKRLKERDGPAVSARWKNHLDPILDHSPFSREDNLALWEGRKKLGNQWVEISAQYFRKKRSKSSLKNMWVSTAFKQFISSEFGPDAYDKVHSAKMEQSNESRGESECQRLRVDQADV